MTVQKIRETISESGKMKVPDILDYFKRFAPDADLKIVKEQAKEMIKEAKRFM
jgi:hypothetical protein